MDRIVCGDVGFGKTEVAMRAAFVAVQAGNQVAVLVPTTLLAQQHLARASATASPTGRCASRRCRASAPAKESEAVLEGLEQGKVDIVIATHRLLHATRASRELGLIIVDEEHRFGVRDKERLKALRAEVHVLTLTATPIPRTLNMALGGLRDLSLITTAAGRAPGDQDLRHRVARRHAPRGGAARAAPRRPGLLRPQRGRRPSRRSPPTCARWCREADVRIGHGQMRERDLEQLMVDFYHRRFNVLLCTTIIESGIDVPTANTILINRADRFGLAQLHQLRGRVGRSHHRAYAYLIVPSRKAPDAPMPPSAWRRSSRWRNWARASCWRRTTWRSAAPASCWASSRAGSSAEVGLTMYLDMLEQAVRRLRRAASRRSSGRWPRRPRSSCTCRRLLPDDFVPDVHLRLALYQRIAAADAASARRTWPAS